MKRQAEINIRNNITQESIKEVDNQYSDYNVLIRDKIVKELVKEKLEDKKSFAEKVSEEYKKLKSPYQDETGQTYLLESDPYQWMRYTENILKHGHPGDVIKDGDSYDNYMFAPVGCEVVSVRGFFYLSAYLYKVFTFFAGEISLSKFAFYLPIFYLTLFLLLLYFICKKIFSEMIAIITVFLIGLNPAFLQKSCAGWFDYDALVIIVPLIIVFFIYLSLKNNRNFKKLIIYSVLASLSFGIYSFVWVGFFWVFVIVGLSIGFNLLNRYSLVLKIDKEIIGYFAAGVIFLIGSFVFCLLMSDNNLYSYMSYYLSNRSMLTSAYRTSNIFPNTFYTVSELMRTNIDVIAGSYGKILFVFGLLGAFWVYIKEKRSDKKDILIMLLFWLFFMLYYSLKSIRFMTFLSVPFSIFVSIFIVSAFKSVKKYVKETKVLYSYTLIFVLVIALLGWMYIARAYVTAESIYPIFNNSWNKAMKCIKEKTPKKSIINSWWDYGNYFKVGGKRRVIFDPQSQTGSLSYWMARVLLNNNEEESLKILRMINNSSYNLFFDINKHFKDEFKTIALLNKILDGSIKQAEVLLTESQTPAGLKKKIINTIFLKNPSPVYLIAERHMIDVIQAISFLGTWDFKKVYVVKNKTLPKEKIVNNLISLFSLPNDKAESVYNEIILANSDEELNQIISKVYGFAFGLGEGKREKNLIYFSNGIIANIKDLSARIYLPNCGAYKEFKYIYYYDGHKLLFSEKKETDYETACLLIKDKDKWKSICLSKELGDSLIVKLYFLKGGGLKHFEPFYSDDDAGIYIYKVNFEGNKNE